MTTITRTKAKYRDVCGRLAGDRIKSKSRRNPEGLSTDLLAGHDSRPPAY